MGTFDNALRKWNLFKWSSVYNKLNSGEGSIMSNSSHLDCYYEAACEFTVPIRLNAPIWLEPQIIVTPVPCISQKLPIQLEPEISLKPEVNAALPSCSEGSCDSDCETEIPDCETEIPEDCLAPSPKLALLKICSVLLLLLCLTVVLHSFS